MVDQTRYSASLHAMNYALVIVRRMASERKSHEDIVTVVDILEYLPRLIADRRNKTIEYRHCLEDLARRWKEFSPALEYFDAGGDDDW